VDSIGQKLRSHSYGFPPTGSFNSLTIEITGIRTKYPNSHFLSDDASIAEKMSWGALRETTRVEVLAYLLLGIFGVNMPLLYGEKGRAFRRLQEATISSSDDQSIFVWRYKEVRLLLGDGHLLASPSTDFGGYADRVPYTPDWAGFSYYSMTNADLQVSMRLRKMPGSGNTFYRVIELRPAQ
jgi:hypothetical protein